MCFLPICPNCVLVSFYPCVFYTHVPAVSLCLSTHVSFTHVLIVSLCLSTRVSFTHVLIVPLCLFTQCVFYPRPNCVLVSFYPCVFYPRLNCVRVSFYPCVLYPRPNCVLVSFYLCVFYPHVPTVSLHLCVHSRFVSRPCAVLFATGSVPVHTVTVSHLSHLISHLVSIHNVPSVIFLITPAAVTVTKSRKYVPEFRTVTYAERVHNRCRCWICGSGCAVLM